MGELPSLHSRMSVNVKLHFTHWYCPLRCMTPLSLRARSDKGVMQRNGQYQCVKCNLTFTDIREWRDGSSPIATQEKT